MGRNPLKKTLRPYQTEMVERILNNEYFFLVATMRSGKTLVSCTVIDKLKLKTLIICPPAVVKTWEAEMAPFDHKDYKIISDGQLPYKKKVAELGNDWEFVIVDEVHKYRSYSSRTQALKRLSKNSKKRLGLTGTPFDSDYSELFYVMLFLDKGELFGTCKEVFHQHFCRAIYPYSRYPKYKFNEQLIPQLETTLKKFTHTFTSEKLVIPEIETVSFDLTYEQKRIVDGLRQREDVPQICNEHIDMEIAIVNNKINQIYSGFYINRENVPIQVCKSNKWDALRKLLEQNKGKIILWVRYIQEKEIIKQLFSKEYTTFFYPKVDIKTLSDLPSWLLVCHPKSAGTGVDLSFADLSIFVSHLHNYIDVVQSLARMTVYNSKEKKRIINLYANDKTAVIQQQKMNKKQKEMERFFNNV